MSLYSKYGAQSQINLKAFNSSLIQGVMPDVSLGNAQPSKFESLESAIQALLDISYIKLTNGKARLLSQSTLKSWIESKETDGCNLKFYNKYLSKNHYVDIASPSQAIQSGHYLEYLITGFSSGNAEKGILTGTGKQAKAQMKRIEEQAAIGKDYLLKNNLVDFESDQFQHSISIGNVIKGEIDINGKIIIDIKCTALLGYEKSKWSKYGWIYEQEFINHPNHVRNNRHATIQKNHYQLLSYLDTGVKKDFVFFVMSSKEVGKYQAIGFKWDDQKIIGHIELLMENIESINAAIEKEEIQTPNPSISRCQKCIFFNQCNFAKKDNPINWF